MEIYTILFQPKPFSLRSGMYPMSEAVGAKPVFFSLSHDRLNGVLGWTVSHAIRRFGVRYYGSAWNGLVPIWDELRLARECRFTERGIVHFLWSEFASPRWPRLFRKRGSAVIGTFHCSYRRLPEVLNRFRLLPSYDHITLMSETQRPFFLERGFPEERLSVILHGVDTTYFRPADEMDWSSEGPLRAILVGATERDHGFMASVLKALPEGVLSLTVMTRGGQEVHYRDAPHVNLRSGLSDGELLRLYQEAELVVMPMFDCTANNVFLEAMSCGTPVMTNRVGGVPEYVAPSSGFLMAEKDVDSWREQLTHLQRERRALHEMRPNVRAWTERFDWNKVAGAYHRVYEEVLRTN